MSPVRTLLLALGAFALCGDGRAAATGTEPDANVPYEGPEPDRTLQPIYDPQVLAPGHAASIELTARIAADGRVEAIAAAEGTKASPLLDAAKAAFRQWVFKPAVAGGTPQPSLHTERFWFRGPEVFRTVAPIATSELMARLPQLLESWYAVVALPEAGGFVVTGRRHEAEGWRWARSLLIRLGEEPGTSSTWVSVRAFEMRQKKRSDCGCVWVLHAPPGAREFLEVLQAKLGFEAEIRAVAAPGFGIPSGLLEAAGAGEWGHKPVERLLRLSLSDAREHPLPEEIPAAAEFLRRQLPSKAGDKPVARSESVPPKLVKTVRPVYPARRRRISGKVILQAGIDETGNVTKVEVLRSVPALDTAAVEAVCCWKYEPAKKGGKPIEVFWTVVVEYK